MWPQTAQSIRCPGGASPVRGQAVHTQADYSLACTGRSGKNGPYEERFHDGALAVAGQYRNGRPEGVWTFRYRGGGELSSGAFRGGKKEGFWTSYFENGRKQNAGSFHQDVPEGLWRTWYENASRESEGRYAHGEKTGRWTYWFRNGQPDRSGEYRGTHLLEGLDEPVPAEWGKWTYWYETGAKHREGCFEKGRQVGAWTEWSPEGRILSRQDYDRPSPDTACR
jgi:antitoxin component YwqK of YwqJK toxin-antitoxin module